MFYICRRLISVHMRVFLFVFFIFCCLLYSSDLLVRFMIIIFQKAVILFFGIFYIKYFKQIALSINNCKMLAL